MGIFVKYIYEFVKIEQEVLPGFINKRMKKVLIFLILIHVSLFQYGQIIADHTVVERFDRIPAFYMAEVQKMLLVIPGESHSGGYVGGLQLLEAAYPAYDCYYNIELAPETYTADHLRVTRYMWGNYLSATGWRDSFGEEDWWTNSTGISRVKSSIDYFAANNMAISALGFAWCWDDSNFNGPTASADPVYGVRWWGQSVGSPSGDGPWGLDAADVAQTGNSVSLDTYLAATQQYVDYCKTKGYATKVFFTTGPVDTYYTGEAGYQAYLKHERIRAYVEQTQTEYCLIMRIFFAIMKVQQIQARRNGMGIRIP